MIYNNGDLPRGWTVETLKIKHTSEPANPDIAKAFFRAGYIETWGRGTVNIVDYCTQAGLPEPTFEGKWGGLAVIFTVQKDARPWETIDGSTKGVSEKTTQKTTQKTTRKTTRKTTQKIIELIKQNPKISRKDLANKIGNITEDGVKYNLNKLKQEGKLKRIGPDKGGYWEVIDKE